MWEPKILITKYILKNFMINPHDEIQLGKLSWRSQIRTLIFKFLSRCSTIWTIESSLIRYNIIASEILGTTQLLSARTCSFLIPFQNSQGNMNRKLRNYRFVPSLWGWFWNRNILQEPLRMIWSWIVFKVLLKGSSILIRFTSIEIGCVHLICNSEVRYSYIFVKARSSQRRAGLAAYPVSASTLIRCWVYSHVYIFH